MYQTILVTLDGSPLAESVLPHAEAIGRQFEAELILLQAVPSPVTVAVGYYDQVSHEVLETLRDIARHSAEQYIEAQVAALAKGHSKGRGEVVEGEAVTCILRCAVERNVDLIAMATHGRSGLGRWVYGSVADRVLRGADRPVPSTTDTTGGGRWTRISW